MANIDERIVKMKFDSSGFASSAKSALSLLDKIKESINFKGSTNGIDQVSDSVSRFSTSNMTSQVDQVSASFSAMGAVAFSVLNNITDRAVNAGLNIAKSLTIQPLTDGFQEYQTNLNSIQTILANTQSKGSTLDDVTASLDQLNTYSDQTSYNFSEMARNIGTFTAAGVGLDTSVASIKGIANVAALSGSTSEQASSAMYQLSQAIATNKVGLQDWNSVVNAGMGGEVFQSALFETGKALGTLADVPMDQSFEEWQEAGNSFRDSLADGWIDGEVLTTTLEGFTGDLDEAQLKAKGYSDEQAAAIMKMAETAKKAATEIKTIPQLFDTLKESVGSGWAKTWEIVFGNFEESKELLTGVGSTLGGFVDNFSDARNDLLQGWKDLGGRDDVIAGLKNAAQGLFSVLKPIKDAFRDIFPPMTAQQLADASEKFRQLTERIKVSDETAEKIKRTFKGVFAIFSIAGQIIGGVIGVFAKLFGAMSGGTGGILSVTASIGDLIVAFDEALKNGTFLETFFGGLGGVLSGAMEWIGKIASGIGQIFDGFRETDAESMTDGLNNSASALERFGEMVRSILDGTVDLIQAGVKKIGELFSGIFENVSFDNITTGLGIGLFGGLVIVLKKGFDKLKDVFENFDVTGGVIDSIKGTFDALTGSLEAMQTSLKADALMKLGIAIALLAGSVLILSSIDPVRLASALGGLGVSLGLMLAGMSVISKMSSVINLPVAAAGMVLIASAMVILAAAVKIFSTMDWGELLKGLTGLAGGMLILVGAVKALDGVSKGLPSTGLGMILIATATLILAKAVESFSGMDWGELAKGLTGLAVSLALIVGAMKLMPTEGMVQAGAGLVLIAAGTRILAESVKTFADMDWGELAKGLVGFGVSLGIVTAAVNLMPKEGMVKAGAAMILLGAGMIVMAKAVGDFGSMDFGSLVKGLLGMSIALLAVAGATQLMPDNLPAIGVGLVLVSIGVKLLADAVIAMADLSIGEIVKGLIGLGGSLLIIAGAMALMPPNMAATAAGLVLVGVALKMIGSAVENMGGMSWNEVAKGLVALGGALLIIGAALIFMQGTIAGSAALLLAAGALAILTPVIIALSGLGWGALLTGLGGLALALAAIAGVSVLLTAAVPSISALGLAIGVLAGAMLIGATAFLVFSSAMALLAGPARAGMEVLQELVDFIPQVLISLAEGLAEFIVTLAGKSAEIMTALGTMMSDFIQTAAQVVIDNVPIMVEAFIALGEGILETVDTLGPQIMETFGNLLSSLFAMIIEKAPEAGNAVLALLVAIVDTVTAFIPYFASKGAEMVISLINTMTSYVPQFIQAGADFVIACMEGLSSAVPQVVAAAVQMVIDIANGIATELNNKQPELEAAFRRMGAAIIEALIAAIRGGFSGVLSAIGDVLSGAISKGREILEINSPSKVFRRMGDSVMEGFVAGIDRNADSGAKAVGDAFTGAIRQARKDSKKLTEILKADPEKDAAKANETQTKINDNAVAPETPEKKSNDNVNVNKDCPETTQLENCNENYGDAVEERNDLRTDLDENAPEPDNPNGDTPVVEAAEAETDALKDDNEEFEDAVSDRALTQKELKETLSDFVDMFKAIQGVTGDLSDGVEAVRDMFEMGTKLIRHLTFGSYMRNRLAGQQGRILGHAIATGMDEGMQEGFKTVDETTGNMVKNAVYVTEKELGFYDKDDKFAKIGMKASNSFQGAFAGLFNLDQTASFKTIKRVMGEYFDEFVEFFDDLDKGIGRITTMITAITNISTAIMTFVPGASAAFAGAGATLTAALATGMIGGFPVAAVVAAVGIALVAIVAIFAFWGDDIIAIGGKVLGFIADTIKTVVTSIEKFIGWFFGGTVAKIKSVVEEIADTIKTVVTSIPKFIGWFFGGTVAKIKSVVEEIANSDFVKSVVRLVSAIAMFFGAIVGGILKLLASPLKPLFAWLAGIVVHIKNIMDGTFGGVLDILLSVLKPIGTILGWLINHIADAIEDASGTITKVFDFLSFMVEGLFSVIFGLFKAIITDPIFNIMLGAIQLTVKVIVGMFTIVDNAVRFVLTAFDNITNAVKGLMDVIFNGLFGGILGFGAQLGGAIGGVALEVINAFKSILGIQSPSKVFSDLAEFIPAGVAQGIQKNSWAATDAANILGEDIVTSMEQTLANIEADVLGEIEFNPVVTPVVDLDALKQGKNEIDRLLGNSTASGMAHAVDISNYTAASRYESDGEMVGTDQGTTTFVQNNYSPKALSPIEIYRNTKNQLSMSAKGAKPGDRV